jgi:hypothetical protein
VVSILGIAILGSSNFRWSAVEPKETINSIAAKEKFGGREEIRTPDPLLAKQVLSQLSYTPTVETTFILRHLPSFRKLIPPFPSMTV